jgi:D-beta-D-heptose 7-phosphate kinase/D-beta-D-heptose 1-phosphate adenosyltransferase
VNIAVFGDTIIDRHMTINSVKENYEQSGTLKANVSFRHTTPGGAANVAVNVQALSKFGPNDNAVTLYTAGARGDDYAIVREQLLLAGVTPIVSSTRVRPVIKCRLTNNDITETMSPRITRFDVDPYDHWLTSSVNLIGSEEAGNDLKWPSDVDVFVVSDYHKGFFGLEPRSGDVRARIVNAAADKLLIVDPGRHIPGRHLSNWQAWGSKDTIFKFNERQAREFLTFSEQPIAPDEEPEMLYRVVYNLFKQKKADYGVLFKHLVITFGDKGYVTFDNDFIHVPTPYKHLLPNLTDVCGAGDTFLAGLAVGLTEGMPFVAACDFAQSAAGVAVRTPGTATVTRKDALK